MSNPLTEPQGGDGFPSDIKDSSCLIFIWKRQLDHESLEVAKS